MVTENTTVCAQWIVGTAQSFYTVTFDADGGSPAERTVEMNDSTSVGSTSTSSLTPMLRSLSTQAGF
ncbi:MAG: hypothetical protein LBK00_05485 [Treponema sp.]|nr:hypothetical protein [Treponema sp.]